MMEHNNACNNRPVETDYDVATEGEMANTP